MDAQIKNIVKVISETSPYNVEVLSEICKRTICNADTCAIFLEQEKRRVVLMVRDDDECEKNFNRAFFLISELLATFTKLENDNCIYLLPANVADDELLFEEYEIRECDTIDERVYEMVLNGSISLRGAVLETGVSESLLRFLNSFIIPTQQLSDFVARDFLTQAEFDQKTAINVSQRSLCVSRIAIGISVFIAIFSCVLPTFINNKFGYATIDSVQFDSLVNTIKEDSIVAVPVIIEKNINVKQVHKPTKK